MSHKWGKKSDWPVVSTRIDPVKKQQLIKKHPADGEVSLVIRALLDMYLQGRIIGVRLNSTT